MADRRAFLLRVDPAVLEALQRWANDDLRSLNGQIEFVLRQALKANRRIPASPGSEASGDGPWAPPAAPKGRPRG